MLEAAVPKCTVVYFKAADGEIPVRVWLDEFVAKRGEKALAKCKARLKYLRDNGLACRRPYADSLRDGIYELRAEHGNVNYRMLYFFGDHATAVVAVGLTKESRVPDKDIELARERKLLFESDPGRFTHHEQTQESD